MGLIVFVVLAALLAVTMVMNYGDKATALNNEAVKLINMEKYDSALQKLDEAIAENPEHAEAHYHRGICYAKKGQWDEAVAAFDRAIAINPLDANSFYGKGEVQRSARRYQECADSVERALQLKEHLKKNNLRNSYYSLGECLYEIFLAKVASSPEEAGSPQRAIDIFKSFLAMGADTVDKRNVERKIKILESPEMYQEAIEKRKPENLEKKKRITLEELKKEVESQP